MGKDIKGKELGSGYTQESSGLYKKTFYFNGKQKAVRGKTLKECEAKYNDMLQELENGRYNPERKPTLNEFFETWIADKEKETIVRGRIKMNRSVRGSTIHSYKTIYDKHIRGRLGDYKLNKITETVLNDFQWDIASPELNKGKGYSSKTINDITGLVRQLLKSAYKKKLMKVELSEYIVTVVDNDEEEERKEEKREALSPEHLKLFLECAKDSYYYPEMQMLVYTGMRSGELRGLRWSDYDRDNNVLHIRRTASVDANNKVTMNDTKTKNGKRDLPLTPEIIRVFDEVRKRESMMRNNKIIGIDDYIFKSVRGCIISKNSLRSAFVHTCERAKKIDPTFVTFSPHKLRHNFITTALNQGVNKNLVQDVVGHRIDSDITERIYRDRDKRKIDEAMKQIKIMA